MSEPNAEPTLEQIEEACREIREYWTDDECYRRSGYVEGYRPYWTVPGSRMAEMRP